MCDHSTGRNYPSRLIPFLKEEGMVVMRILAAQEKLEKYPQEGAIVITVKERKQGIHNTLLLSKS